MVWDKSGGSVELVVMRRNICALVSRLLSMTQLRKTFIGGRSLNDVSHVLKISNSKLIGGAYCDNDLPSRKRKKYGLHEVDSLRNCDFHRCHAEDCISVISYFHLSLLSSSSLCKRSWVQVLEATGYSRSNFFLSLTQCSMKLQIIDQFDDFQFL